MAQQSFSFVGLILKLLYFGSLFFKHIYYGFED